VWQQIKNGVVLADIGEAVTKELVGKILDEEVAKLAQQVPADQFERFYVPAKQLIADLVLSDDFTDFLTLPAYELVK
jgi:malate synthase